MDVFHVVFDTSLLHKTHFGHPNFERLLRRVQQGVLKLYVPYIVLEERRTQLIDEHDRLVEEVRSKFNALQRDYLSILTKDLPAPVLSLPTKEEVDRNSYRTIGQFISDNKVEVIPITIDHAHSAWERYFGVKLPFNPREPRENRRKDIPDSWILEAALEVKAKPGRHCVLIKDGKLETALGEAGFELYDDVEKLEAEIEKSSSIITIQVPTLQAAAIPLNQLRSQDFTNVDVIVLGMNEALNSPSKAILFSTLEHLGINRAIAEHEAQTLVLSGILNDTGSHLIPTDRHLAVQASNEQIVQELLLKALEL